MHWSASCGVFHQQCFAIGNCTTTAKGRSSEATHDTKRWRKRGRALRATYTTLLSFFSPASLPRCQTLAMVRLWRCAQMMCMRLPARVNACCVPCLSCRTIPLSTPAFCVRHDASLFPSSLLAGAMPPPYPRTSSFAMRLMSVHVCLIGRRHGSSRTRERLHSSTGDAAALGSETHIHTHKEASAHVVHLLSRLH